MRWSFINKPFQKVEKGQFGRLSKMMKSIAVVLCVATVLLNPTEATLELTSDDFQEKVFGGGKNVFIKFFAPWCGHCKKMKPDWDKLAAKYDGSSSVLIADVDCTVHQSLCSEYGVSGYPTLKYFKDGEKEAQAYQGGRSLDALEKFVKDNLEIQCTTADPSLCSEKEQKYIEKMKGKESADITKELERLGKMAGGSMKPELKQWLVARMNILKQLSATE